MAFQNDYTIIIMTVFVRMRVYSGLCRKKHFFFYDFPTRTLYIVYDRLFVYIIRVHGVFLVPKTAHNALAIARALVCVCMCVY